MTDTELSQETAFGSNEMRDDLATLTELTGRLTMKIGKARRIANSPGEEVGARIDGVFDCPYGDENHYYITEDARESGVQSCETCKIMARTEPSVNRGSIDLEKERLQRAASALCLYDGDPVGDDRPCQGCLDIAREMLAAVDGGQA